MNVILVPFVLDCHAHIETWMSSGTSLVGPLHCTARFFDFIYLFIYCIFLAQHLHQSQQTSWWQLRRHTDWTIRRQARGDNSVALWVGTGDPQDLSASGAGQCHRLCRVLPPSARHLVTPVRATDLRSQTSWTRDGGDDLHFFSTKVWSKYYFWNLICRHRSDEQVITKFLIPFLQSNLYSVTITNCLHTLGKLHPLTWTRRCRDYLSSLTSGLVR